MTPKEFKAWFDGFTEAMDGHPTPAQWEKIRQRVSEIDGNPVSYPVYMDRYWPRPGRWVETWSAGNSAGNSAMMDISTAKHGGLTAEIAKGQSFDPLPAMKALGLADYSETESA